MTSDILHTMTMRQFHMALAAGALRREQLDEAVFHMKRGEQFRRELDQMRKNTK